MFGSITSGLLDNDRLKQIGLARILGMSPFVGYIDDFILMVNKYATRTFDGLSRKSTARYHDHAVINGKPIPELTGYELDDIVFELTLTSALGVDPLTEYEALRSKVLSGKVMNIFLHGRLEGAFNIRSIECEETHWSKGRPAVMKISLICKEYIESIPLAVAQKLQATLDANPMGPERLPIQNLLFLNHLY